MTLPNGHGNPAASYMIVGDHYSFEDDRKKQAFADGSGTIMSKMLQDAGILVSDCWFTNVVNAMPRGGDGDYWYPTKKQDLEPRHMDVLGRKVDPIVVEGLALLNQQIALVKPKAIITVGNPGLWALTGNWGALSWRGSMLRAMGTPIPLVPTLHPRFISAQWQWRSVCIKDIQRAKRLVESPPSEPDRHFILRPDLDTTLGVLNKLLQRCEAGEALWVDVDLETNLGHIVCLGLSWSRTEAICIPFASSGLHRNYWSTPEEEGVVVFAVYRLLTHRNVAVRWQNGLFDAQYIFKHWHFIPRGKQDTMISHHSMWAGMQKSLAFQASMYCDHYVYWKDMRTGAETKEGA